MRGVSIILSTPWGQAESQKCHLLHQRCSHWERQAEKQLTGSGVREAASCRGESKGWGRGGVRWEARGRGGGRALSAGCLPRDGVSLFTSSSSSTHVWTEWHLSRKCRIMLKNQEFLLHFRDNEDEGHTGTAVVLFQLQVLLQSAAPPPSFTQPVQARIGGSLLFCLLSCELHVILNSSASLLW